MDISKNGIACTKKKTGRIQITAPVNISKKNFKYVISNKAFGISSLTSLKYRIHPIQLLTMITTDSIYAAQNGLAFPMVFFLYFYSYFLIPIINMICRFIIITRTYTDSLFSINTRLLRPKPGSEELALSAMGDTSRISITASASVVSPIGLSCCAGIYNGNQCISLPANISILERKSPTVSRYVY